MLLVNKSLNGYINIAPSSLGLELSHSSSRRGGFRLTISSLIRSDGRQFLLQGTPRMGPDSCIKCVSVASFKSAFRKYFKIYI